MEILMNLPLFEEISNVAATFSTSGVGSTPGKRTKKIGTFFYVSGKTSIILKGGCSTYRSPIFSWTN